MMANPVIRYLTTLLLATLLLVVTLPAGASVTHAAEGGQVFSSATHDEHEERCCLPEQERCCLPELGGHGLCHASAALPAEDSPRVSTPSHSPVQTVRIQFLTRPQPPLLKPPTITL
jgi:hypothetical protein